MEVADNVSIVAQELAYAFHSVTIVHEYDSLLIAEAAQQCIESAELVAFRTLHGVQTYAVGCLLFVGEVVDVDGALHANERRHLIGVGS